jgi:hypothetical protein
MLVVMMTSVVKVEGFGDDGGAPGNAGCDDDIGGEGRGLW